MATSYNYTLNGLLRSESNATGTVSYVYDAFGRVTSETTPESVKQYTYNLTNMLSLM